MHRSIKNIDADRLFICHFAPFIRHELSSISPFIRINVPLVGFRNLFGFTLIELMVTLVVVAVLVTIGAPAFTTFIANQRLSTQANDLISDLVFARSEAVKRSSAVTICKTADPNAASPTCDATVADRWTAGRLIFLDNNNDGQHDAGEQIMRVRQALEGSDTTGNMLLGDGSGTGTASRITFSANGATNLAAESELTLCDRRGDSQAIAVAVHPLGRARVTARGKDKDGNSITVCP